VRAGLKALAAPAGAQQPQPLRETRARRKNGEDFAAEIGASSVQIARRDVHVN
jgi:hypothetical protein